MPDQLTSVRLDEDTLAGLRLLAELNNSNVAAEIREGVRRYIADVTSAPDFEARLEEADRARRAAAARAVALNRR